MVKKVRSLGMYSLFMVKKIHFIYPTRPLPYIPTNIIRATILKSKWNKLTWFQDKF